MLAENEVVGGGKRYAKCIRCGATDRDRLVYLYLRDHTDIFKNIAAKVLHVAPEKVLRKVLEKSFAKGYIAGDKFTKGYHYGKGTVAIDITAITYEDAFFDLIICNHVLEHIVNDHDAIAELCRVLKPDGIAILQVPISKKNAATIEDKTVLSASDRRRVFGQHDHVRIYGQDYIQRLEHGGFEVSRVSIAREYPDAALNADEEVFVGSR